MKPQEQQREHYVGQRLSLKNQSFTVRYIGPVADKPGKWLGVEWDDPKRGKHNGIHEGIAYFTCRSKSPIAGSFLRPTQSWDTPRTFLQALQEKYMPEFHKDEAEVVYISGKQAEEIGFEKFSQRQVKLHGIRVLVLDNMRIQHRITGEVEARSIRELCGEITELDLSDNIFETFREIVELSTLFPKLRVLTLDGNRFTVDSDEVYAKLPVVSTLSLSRTLLDTSEVNKAFSAVPSLKTFALTDNEISDLAQLELPSGLSVLDLSDNRLSSISDLRGLHVDCPPILILKRNHISKISADSHPPFSLPVSELDLTYNAIDNWKFFNDITPERFPNLKHLRVTGNPLYKDLVSADGKPLTTEDGYMLTIARLPQLDLLNYAKITEKERLNAETYYLSQIAVEISQAPRGKEAGVLSQHPRYGDLCEEYGEPLIQAKPAKNEIDPNSLAAKLVEITFNLAPSVLPSVIQRTWIEKIPKSFNIYSVLGLVGKRLGVLPLDLQLVLETNESDPVGRNNGYNGPQWWDSSDDEAEDIESEWSKREVELVPGTRALGTYVEGREATVRIKRVFQSEPP